VAVGSWWTKPVRPYGDDDLPVVGQRDEQPDAARLVACVAVVLLDVGLP